MKHAASNNNRFSPSTRPAILGTTSTDNAEYYGISYRPRKQANGLAHSGKINGNAIVLQYAMHYPYPFVN